MNVYTKVLGGQAVHAMDSDFPFPAVIETDPIAKSENSEEHILSAFTFRSHIKPIRECY